MTEIIVRSKRLGEKALELQIWRAEIASTVSLHQCDVSSQLCARIDAQFEMLVALTIVQRY